MFKYDTTTETTPSRNPRLARLLLGLTAVMIVLFAALGQPLNRASTEPLYSPTPSQPAASLLPESQDAELQALVSSPQPSISSLIREAASPTPSPLPPTPSPFYEAALPFAPLQRGVLILSISEGGYSHLFAYQAQSLPFTRLTNGAWNDEAPALSPDGSRLAFASDRDGAWDLYTLDLPSGAVARLTETPAYESSPTWSPDGLWLSYTSYTEGNLDIFIRPVESGLTDGQNSDEFGDQPDDQAAIRLTNGPEADWDPAWSPQGRQIAFVSDRSGEEEIWLADLDRTDERFRNLSRSEDSAEAHPAWSPDGTRLAWAARAGDGTQSLFLFDLADERPTRAAGSGDWPFWSPDGFSLAAALSTPNFEYLTAYSLDQPGLALPPLLLPGPVHGLVWGDMALPTELPAPLAEAASSVPSPLFQRVLTVPADLPEGRYPVVPLEGIEAPHPLLQDLADESFLALRQRAADESGWDFLATLENAYVPITSPLSPGMGADWLYTGRAFAFSPLPLNAGWVVVMREEFGTNTYWRVYLKTRFQDGTQGKPLHSLPWDFSARYAGDPFAYEQGGALAQAIPEGYWIDFTALASAYGWERQPALTTWRSSYPAARFNEFAYTDGLDWQTAMLEIYPPEVLVTPTPVVPTAIPSPTTKPTRTVAPTRTPYMTRTPWPTRTPLPTSTPQSSPTPAAP